MNGQPLLLGLFSQIGGHGGVQRLARAQAVALARIAQGRGWRFEALSWADDAGKRDAEAFGECVVFEGFGGSRLAFAAAAARRARECRFVFANHAHLGPIALGAAAVARAPWAMHLHGIEVWGSLSPARRWALRRAGRLTATSAFTARRTVRRHGVDPARIVVTHPPVPAPCGDAPPCSFPLPDAPYFLAVSRLAVSERRKGIGEALRALDRACPKSGEFVVVGDGDDRPRLESIAEGLAVRDRIRFVGAVDDADLQALLARCRALVLPSTKEGFGIVYAEAMAWGRPAIGARAGGVPEIVVDGRTGWLVQGGGIEELAGAMKHAMDDPGEADRRGRAGRRRVERRLSLDAFAAKLAEAVG